MYVQYIFFKDKQGEFKIDLLPDFGCVQVIYLPLRYKYTALAVGYSNAEEAVSEFQVILAQSQFPSLTLLLAPTISCRHKKEHSLTDYPIFCEVWKCFLAHNFVNITIFDEAGTASSFVFCSLYPDMSSTWSWRWWMWAELLLNCRWKNWTGEFTFLFISESSKDCLCVLTCSVNTTHHHALQLRSCLGRNRYKEQFLFLYRWDQITQQNVSNVNVNQLH